jgi:polygalacturonase
VRKYGGIGDGKTSNTKAIASAIVDMSCTEVLFPSPGTYLSGTILLRSDLSLNIEEGATLKGKDGEFAKAKPNKWDQYQDYGHSHWHDSFIVGDGVRNVTIRGSGTIDGGTLSTRQPKHSGGGCRLLALRSCQDVTFADFHTKNGGWFTLLATDVDGLTIRGTTIAAARDGLDVVGCRNVLVEDVDISGGGDDALVFKSDYSVGRVLPTYNVIVRNSHISSNGCNALNFGSETVGDFSNITWENIVVKSAGKAGIGIVTMDGAHIRDVSYKNITMSGTTTPIHVYIGARQRAPVKKIGAISNIHLEGITATDCKVSHCVDRTSHLRHLHISFLPPPYLSFFVSCMRILHAYPVCVSCMCILLAFIRVRRARGPPRLTVSP